MSEICPKCHRKAVFGIVPWRGEKLCLWCLRDKFSDAEVENERLRAVVDKLPHTADGVPVVPGMKLYPLHPVDWIDEGEDKDEEDHGVVTVALRDAATGEHLIHGYDGFRVGMNYSTPAAAEAAKKATDPQNGG